MGACNLVLFVLGANVALTAATCPNNIASGVKPEELRAVVDKHNQYRRQISNGQVPGQPRGINVGDLQWDQALANQAQNIANTCVFEHVKVNDPRFYVGQNLGKSGSTNKNDIRPDWNGIVQMWFDEYKNFVYPSTSHGVTGHYTQVVWGDTKWIGCGFRVWTEGDWTNKLYVCNYGPGGNWAGQPPYKT